MSDKPKLSEAEITSSCIKILRTFQARVNQAVTDAGLKGDEPHVLNVINNQLFALLCTAELLTGKTKGKPK